MASNLRVDSIVPATGGSVSIGTATGGVNIPGNLGIGGTLTYEDVTNVDSVGVITARSGINVTSGNIALSSNGANVSPSGFDFKIRSNTAKLGIHIDNASGTQTLDFGIGGSQGADITTNSTGPIVFKPNNSERLRITHNGEIGIGGANYGTSGQVLTSQGSGSAVQWATPSSGGMTLLHTMNINMTANTQSQSLNLTGYVKLMGLITGVSRSGGVNDTWLTFNGMNSSGNYSWVRTYLDNSNDTSTNRSGTALGYAYGSVGPGFFLNLAGIAAADSGNIDAEFTVHNLQESGRKIFTMTSRSYLVRYMVIDTRGSINTTSAITSFAINVSNSVSRNTGGTIKLYGFK